ncbi:hypothetical protein LZQ00_11120 [Sphingobacterium sp. SRCM116780]|uniref:hypothetical protein n=1 Tax=Sphingobacterium sp. SRCM116780 TaxID=2907623 RepID=UPI001F18C8F5|nr:hypothetical protein [Sphingobacterium sp. SRCM116780]UIR54828.1 hypothetical protein LZQ00_11120 [Sphingobacterium sp. SRCM116780]
MSDTKVRRLKRFTTLPVLLDFLQRKKLVLLDPKLWDDRNDSEVILEYKARKGIKNLFALCFTYGDETVHHWKTFSNGPSGCVIEFNASKLFEIIDAIPNLRHKKVTYKKLREVENKDYNFEVEEMPFIKRWPYRCEEEYRFIAESDQQNQSFFEIDVPLSIINKIIISQQMPKQIYDTIKKYLNAIEGHESKRINRSTLYENSRWLKQFKNK